MNNLQFTQLGVSGLLVAALIVALRYVWNERKELLRLLLAAQQQNRDDSRAMLPALADATTAVAGSTLAIDRVTRLMDDMQRRQP